MLSFALHFIPLAAISYVILAFITRRYGITPRAFRIKTAVVALFAVFAYRSFVIAMWEISPPGLFAYSVFVLAMMINVKKPRHEFPYHIAVKFVVFFPLYMFIVILVFSLSIGHDCEKMSKQKGFEPIYSLCDKENYRMAKTYTNNVYHCRNAFMGSFKDIVYVAFGAETNNDKQIILGVNRKTRAISNKIYTYTVFRGYCDPELKLCLHVVTPKNMLRLWDEEKQEFIGHYVNRSKRRPRFITVDEAAKKVYVLYDGAYFQAVDLKKCAEQKKLVVEQKVKMPSNSLATIANTKKRIIINSSLFFNPYIFVVDKKTNAISKIYVGRSSMLTSLGMYFHLAGAPERERVFIGAPFEGAVYMVDLDKKKTVWRKKLPVGIRCVGYDSKRQMLYASNFVDGWVYILDVAGDKNDIIGKIFVGRRARFFEYMDKDDIFLSASANGFYIFNPETGLKDIDKSEISF